MKKIHAITRALRDSSDAHMMHRRAERAKFVSGHQHACVSLACRKKYSCTNECDPHELTSSLCPTCYHNFAEAA